MQNRIDIERSRTLLKQKLDTFDIPPGAEGLSTALEGLKFHRFESNRDPKPNIYRPTMIVIAQGSKFIRIGNEEYIYGESSFFITGVDMPAASCVCNIVPGKPYLSVSLDLDRALLAQLAAEVDPGSPAGAGAGSHCGAYVHPLDAPMLDAFLRLAELVEQPDELRVLGPLIVKEIHYRLLAGPFGNALRQFNTFGSQSNQISRAVSWLMKNFKDPLQVDELARSVNMAPSTFHRHFKDVTTLSPLQYQKRLRLSEAQRLMLADSYDATQACHAVGYESVTQFNREYKRLFGDSPRRDVSARIG